MLGNVRRSSGQLEAVGRIAVWTRERFSLGDAAVVMVAEIECKMPGCPPLETVVAFWGGDGTRYRFKVFKPVAEVLEDDLPIAWLLPSLVDYGDLGCDCC